MLDVNVSRDVALYQSSMYLFLKNEKDAIVNCRLYQMEKCSYV